MKEVGNVIKEILDNIGDGILFLDREYKVIFANRTVLQLCGQKEEDVIGRECHNLFHRSSMPCHKKDTSVVCPYNEVFKTGMAKAVTHAHVLPDGTERIFDITASPIVNEKGDVIQVVEILRDVTEKKKAEEALLSYKNRLEAVKQIGALASSTLNLDKVLQRILKGTLEASGASVGMLFLKDSNTQKLTWGASIGLSEAFVTDYKDRHIRLGEGLTGRIAQTGETIYIPRDSSHDPRIDRPVVEAEGLNSFIGVPIYAADEIVGVMNILTRPPDILSEEEIPLVAAIGAHVGSAIRNAQLFEERKQVEKKTLTMLDNVVIGISMISPKMEIIWLNKTLKKWFPNIDVRKRPLCYQSFYSPPKEKICDYCPTIKAFKTGEIHSSDTGTCTDGRIYNVIATPVKDKNRQIAYVVETVEDITERRQMEESLLKEKYFSESIINSLPGIFYLFDDKEKFLQWNKNVEGVTGYSSEEISKMSPLDFFVGKDKKIVAEKIREAFVKGKSPVEANLVSKDGKKIPYFFTGVRIGIDDTPYLVGMGIDIADRKQAEEALKRSEKKYRDLVDNALVGVYKTNLKGDILYANKALANILGFESPEEMMKKDVLTRYKNLKDREVLIENLKKTGKVSNFEVEILTKTGETRDMLLSATLVGDTISGMIMDVTEQRRAEKAVKESEIFLSSILEGIQDGVVVLGRDFRVLFANSSYIQQIGSPSSEIRGKHCYDVSYNRDKPCYLAGLECSVKKVFETGLSTREVRKKFDKYMEMTVYPLKNFSGKVVSVVEIRRDVTRNIQLDEELKKRMRELEDFYDMAVGRELKMKELKKEIDELKGELRKHKS